MCNVVFFICNIVSNMDHVSSGWWNEYLRIMSRMNVRLWSTTETGTRTASAPPTSLSPNSHHLNCARNFPSKLNQRPKKDDKFHGKRKIYHTGTYIMKLRFEQFNPFSHVLHFCFTSVLNLAGDKDDIFVRKMYDCKFSPDFPGFPLASKFFNGRAGFSVSATLE